MIFLFIEFDSCKGKVLAIRKQGQFVDSVSSGDECGLVLDQTSFYAEQGGQIFDVGHMEKDGDKVEILFFFCCYFNFNPEISCFYLLFFY